MILFPKYRGKKNLVCTSRRSYINKPYFTLICQAFCVINKHTHTQNHKLPLYFKVFKSSILTTSSTSTALTSSRFQIKKEITVQTEQRTN